MNQVYLEKNIDDLIKEIDLFCCFKMCRLKTITFKLSNNYQENIHFFSREYDLQEKMFLIFSPSRQMYVPFEFVQFAVKRTLDLEKLCNHAFFLVAEQYKSNQKNNLGLTFSLTIALFFGPLLRTLGIRNLIITLVSNQTLEYDFFSYETTRPQSMSMSPFGGGGII